MKKKELNVEPGAMVKLLCSSARKEASLWTEPGRGSSTRGELIEWMNVNGEILTVLANIETKSPDIMHWGACKWLLVMRHRTGTVGWIWLGRTDAAVDTTFFLENVVIL